MVAENERHKKVKRATVKGFIWDKFEISVSDSTVSTLLGNAGFSERSLKTTTGGFMLTDKELVEMYSEFIRNCRLEGLFDNRFWSVDFTYTSYRNDIERGYTPVGGPQLKLARRLSRFTNCIVTCVSSHGEQIPCMIFSYNPAFAEKAARTKTERETRRRVREVAGKMGINLSRVVYLGVEAREKRTYVAESPEIIESFLRFNVVPEGVIFSDGGKSFKRKKVDVIANLGHQHVTYPAAVHQYLSPNDNRLHGEAKNKWRAAQPNFDDDVYSSLLLMQCIDNVPTENIEGWFTKNFMFGAGKVTDEKVRAIISGPAYARFAFHRACCQKYQMKFEDSLVQLATPMHKISSSLDGTFWVDE